jgi:hypothetical protein
MELFIKCKLKTSKLNKSIYNFRWSTPCSLPIPREKAKVDQKKFWFFVNSPPLFRRFSTAEPRLRNECRTDIPELGAK